MLKGKRKKREIEEIIRASDPWEPIGPTPMPDLSDLRNWDKRLMQTYKPFYAPFCDLCCLCTFGKCDLTGGKRGACGIDISAQQARMFLQSCNAGLSAHGAHGAHLIDYLIEKYGEDFKLDLGDRIVIEAPVIRNVLGLKPETLGDLKKAIRYVEEQLIHLVSSTHTGQEGSYIDFESKSLHAGMLDILAMEITDIAQIVTYKYPTSEAETRFVELGWRSVNKDKPVILCLGHNAVTSNAVIDYLVAHNLYDKVEVGGICCTAQDMARYSKHAKIIGPMSRQLFYIRSGIADVILTDEQCVRCDTTLEADKAGAALIAVSDKIAYGLDDMTEKESDEIVKMILRNKKQVLILDPEKAAEVAIRVAIEKLPDRKKELTEPHQVTGLLQDCILCRKCDRVCANLLPVGQAMKEAIEGKLEKLKEVFDRCNGCGKCQQECPQSIPILQLMQAVASGETYKIRAGRGAIGEVEIREAADRIAWGTIPGIVGIVGCPNFPDEIDEVAEMVDEFAKRKYIVMLSGCSAMAASMKKDKEGKTVYERYPPNFYSGGVLNMGSCVSNAHIVGAAIKVANIFAKIPLRANFEAIADYILNRIGACGLAWGAYSQKAISIATGCNRWGIPVVLGPQSAKYRRLYLSDKERTDWTVMDGRKRELVDSDDRCPEHLLTIAESKERAMIEVVKLCIRRNDTHPGRQVKLNNYIDLYKKFMGTLPDDLHHFVRRKADIPLVYKKEVLTFLQEKEWTEKTFLSNPTLIGTYDSKVTLEAIMGPK